MSSSARHYDVGAEVRPDGSTHFRVWAPDATHVALRIEGVKELPLDREPDGYYSLLVPETGAGTHYRYLLDGVALADPASRYQPDGPFGPSEVISPHEFTWRCGTWPGVELPGQVLYEMHPGTFTPEGTWRAATEKLPLLAEVGITTIEVMPLSDFSGRFGWGYDGVFPYAPTRLYGRPDDFRRFVDEAHGIGLGVILDVVYNHLGPDGAVFGRYARSYFASQYGTEWGDALNFDGHESEPVREYFVGNAGYWIDEFRLDGLRFDATQSIHDASSRHVLADMAARARAAARKRQIILIAENEPQHVRIVREPEQGGYGLDCLWNDDFHHSAVVAVTGRREAYYSDHRGTPQELISAAKYGYLFQGQRYAWQKQRRGSSAAGVPALQFVNYVENHDQIANSGDGSRLRLLTSPGRYRALTALLLLMPSTPMLFQGQEFGSSRPFLFFADHGPELAAAVRKGRAEFVRQFPSLASAEAQAMLPAPHDPATFERSKLDWDERISHPHHLNLHRDLLRLRRTDAAFAAQDAELIDGAVLGPEFFVFRYFAERDQDERLVFVNFGATVSEPSLAEPLVAPPDDHEWVVHWSSEHPDYGGSGTPMTNDSNGWCIPPHATIVLRAVPATPVASQPLASPPSAAAGVE